MECMVLVQSKLSSFKKNNNKNWAKEIEIFFLNGKKKISRNPTGIKAEKKTFKKLSRKLDF